MPFVSREELEQQATKVADLEAALAIERANQEVGRLAIRLEAEVVALEESGSLREEALAAAYVIVLGEEEERIKDELVISLKADEHDSEKIDYRSTNGPRITTELKDFLERDSTFDRVREDARADVRAEIRAELIAEEQARVTAELVTEDQREAYRAEIRPEVAESQEMSDFAAATRTQNQETWYSEVVTQVRAAIETEERGREADYRAQVATDYRQSDRGKKYRRQIRDKLEETWRESAIDEVAKAIQDEVLLELLAARAERERAKLRKEAEAAALLEVFEGKGIDMSSLPEDTSVNIYLGNMGTAEKKVRQRSKRTGYDEDVIIKQKVIQWQRILDLTAIGDGRFVVDRDTLAKESSPYKRNDAIPQGTIITIGRTIEDNGKKRLGTYIAADVTFFYDVDSTDDEITSAELPVANIAINDNAAREYDLLEYTH